MKKNLVVVVVVLVLAVEYHCLTRDKLPHSVSWKQLTITWTLYTSYSARSTSFHRGRRRVTLYCGGFGNMTMMAPIRFVMSQESIEIVRRFRGTSGV